jgi:hypothetical protein
MKDCKLETLCVRHVFIFKTEKFVQKESREINYQSITVFKSISKRKREGPERDAKASSCSWNKNKTSSLRRRRRISIMYLYD